MTTLTPNFRIPIPDTNKRPWQNDYRALAQTVDGVLAKYIAVNDFQGAWDNSTLYTAGQTVVDADTAGLYQCQSTHTSAPEGTTFAEDRTDNPTYWVDVSFLVRFRGEWQRATVYNRGDFVVSGYVYAMCTTAHTSTASGTIDDDASSWEYLIDVTDTVATVLNQTFRPVQTLASTHTIVNGDKNNLLQYNGTGHTWGIDATALDDEFELAIVNLGNGTLTIDPTGVQTINGQSTLVLSGRAYCILTRTGASTFETVSLGQTQFTGNTVLAGPADGSFGAVGFRALVAADVPKRTIVSKSTGYTAAASDHESVIIVTASATISLPSGMAAGYHLTVFNTHSAANTVDTQGAELINGAASVSLDQYECGDFVFDGSNWIRTNPDPVVPTVPGLEFITGDDTLTNDDKGKTFVVTGGNFTVAIDAIAGLDTDWNVDIIVDGDYNDLRYVFINPNSSEQIDDQDLIVMYVNERCNIYKNGSAFRSTRTNGLVFFGEGTSSGSAIDLYVDSVFYDDPEIVGGRLVVDGISQSDGSWNLVLQAIDTAGNAIATDYAITTTTAFGTYAGTDTVNATGITASITNTNSGDQFSGLFDLLFQRSDNVFQAFGWSSIMRDGQTEASMRMFSGARNDANAAGLRVTHASGGNFNGGVVRWYGLRARRS